MALASGDSALFSCDQQAGEKWSVKCESFPHLRKDFKVELMRYISLSEVLELHRRIIEESGGSMGLRDLGGLESAIAQPRMTFGGRDLYPALIEKVAALCFSERSEIVLGRIVKVETKKVQALRRRGRDRDRAGCQQMRLF